MYKECQGIYQGNINGILGRHPELDLAIDIKLFMSCDKLLRHFIE